MVEGRKRAIHAGATGYQREQLQPVTPRDESEADRRERREMTSQDALLAEAASNSQDLALATARMAEARATLDQNQSNFYPSVDSARHN